MIARNSKALIFAFIVAGMILVAAALYIFQGTGRSTVSEVAAETGGEASDTRLLQKLESALPEGSTILESYMDEFNKDGRLELFALVNIGEKSKEEFSGVQLWYAEEAGAKMLFDGGIYTDSATVWDVGSRKLFYLEEGYGGSGSVSHVWSVKEDGPYELQHAGESLKYAGNLQFYTYPGAFDLLPDGTGHTWKRYYLYLDEATGMFKEYGGIAISKEDLSRLKGAAGLLDAFDNKGYKIADIFYRENGIINMNYNDGTYNLNITLTVEDGTAALADLGSVEKPDYDHGGIYKAAIFEEIAAYPEKFPY